MVTGGPPNKRLEQTKRGLLVGRPALARRRRASFIGCASQLKRGVMRAGGERVGREA